MQALYQAILDLTSKVVIPDWGELIKLIPLGLLGVVVLWLLVVARGYATAGPTRRAPARRTPVTPAHLHMPGPSYAPIAAAVGAAALLWGLVVGGDALLVGVVVLVAALLYWGREAVREYDRMAREAAGAQTLPAVVHEGPPPGVHMPGPSFRPILGALGVTALLGGLVAGGWLLAAGVIILVMTLVGWLVDARAEYVKTEQADRTGHMENIPDPTWPRRLLQVGAVLFVLAALLETGVLPPKASQSAAGGPGASSGPVAEATPATAYDITAKDIAYDKHAITVPAGTAFTITFTNADSPGVTHDVDIRATDKTTVLQNQDVTNGGSKSTYQYKGLPAGTYIFICSIHPIANMTGTLTVK